MGRRATASNTQKTILTALAEGWLLRYVNDYGWCLFQVGRKRPFARVRTRTVEKMTDLGWLTPGRTSRTHGFRPAKDLTPLGRRLADHLLREEWAMNDDWAPPITDAVFRPDETDQHRRAA